MNQIEDMVSFVVLCPDLNIGGLKLTISSIKTYFPNTPYACIVGDNAKGEDIKEINNICPVRKAKGTITSLINCGVKQSNKKWCFIVMAGVYIIPSIFKKYQCFLTSDHEIFYQITSKKAWVFNESTINGILINKNAIIEVGELPDDESIVKSKLLWATEANEKGYKFKGIVGVKL